MDRIEEPLWGSGVKGWKGDSWHCFALVGCSSNGVPKEGNTLPLATANALANRKRADRGEKAITMDALASEIGVAATAIARLAAQQQGNAPIALASGGEDLDGA